MTSPPYWALRNYEEEKQIGLQDDFIEYINNLCDIFDQVKRVLKKEGTCFVNIGDTYGGSGSGSCKNPKKTINKSKNNYLLPYGNSSTYKLRNSNFNKSLLQIPSRFAIEMCNRGWILRNEIIWKKDNAMPSAVKDRFTVDFEKIFFFTKSKKYYFEQQFQPYLNDINRWGGNSLNPKSQSEWDNNVNQKTYRKRNMRPNELGRNKRTVWSINTKATKYKHFATYPPKLCETPIKAGCPQFVCEKCNKSFNYTIEKCNCNSNFKRGIVLDPFMGSGTTGMVAKYLNRDFLGIEINKEYIEIALQRINNWQKEGI